MNFLVVNMPCYGDNVPTEGFVAELAKKGHKVDVISSTKCCLRIGELFHHENVHFIDYDLNQENMTKGELSTEDDSILFGAMLYKVFDEIENYDAIIYDYFAFPLYYKLKESKKCFIRFFPNFAFNPALSERIFRGPESTVFQNSYAKQMGDITINYLKKKGLAFKYNDMCDEVTYNIPPLTLVHTIKEMQPYAEDFDDRFKYVGASSSPDTQTIAIPFDKMKGPRIYVSFGTWLTAAGDCRKDLYISFFDAFKDDDVSVIMAIGDNNLINKEDIPDNFYVYDFVPPTTVMKHADLFITHCGQNSVNDALCHGVPMLGIPGGYDQFITAELLEERKIGHKLDFDKATPEKIRQLAFDILNNEDYKKNMQKLQDSITKTDSNRYTADVIEEYVNNFYSRKN